LLEDDEDQREVRTLLLEAKGHVVVEENEDLVLMDLRMPETEDGLALLRRLGGKIPVVVLTGYAADLIGKPEEALAAAILEKPCPAGKLLQAIERCCSK
jgi:CheY-like chemotaxis protein